MVEACVISCRNCNYPSHQSLEYFITFSCFHTTTHAVHICFQMIILYTYNLENGNGTNVLRNELFFFLHKIWWINEACFTLAELVNICSSPLWAQVNPFAMCNHVTSAVTMRCLWIDHLIRCANWW